MHWGGQPRPWCGDRLHAHLLPFDACRSHGPWWSLCDLKKGCVMPSIFLGHAEAPSGPVISPAVGSTSHLVLSQSCGHPQNTYQTDSWPCLPEITLRSKQRT